MNDRNEHSRITQLIPAPAGWKAVYAYDPGRDPLDECGADELLYTVDVVAFALVEVWWSWTKYDVEPDPELGGEWRDQRIDPVILTEDNYLEAEGDGYLRVSLAEPGSPNLDRFLPRARDLVALERKRLAAAAAARTTNSAVGEAAGRSTT